MRPTTLSRDRIVQTARSFRAEAHDVTLLGEGQMTIAVSVGRYVLRFPRSGFAREELRREVSVLDVIRDRVSASVPDIVEVQLDRPIGESFVAHGLLPGTPLTAATLASIGPSTKARVAEQVSRFLRELHAIPAGALRDAPVQPVAELGAALLDEAKELLWARLNGPARAQVEREVHAMAAIPAELSVPCASDIGGNILFDAGSGSVSFIDFAGVVVTDPIVEVASLAALDEGLARACADLDEVLAARVEGSRIVRATFVLQDALYGARQQDWKHVEECLVHYTQRPD